MTNSSGIVSDVIMMEYHDFTPEKSGQYSAQNHCG